MYTQTILILLDRVCGWPIFGDIITAIKFPILIHPFTKCSSLYLTHRWALELNNHNPGKSWEVLGSPGKSGEVLGSPNTPPSIFDLDWVGVTLLTIHPPMI